MFNVFNGLPSLTHFCFIIYSIALNLTTDDQKDDGQVRGKKKRNIVRYRKKAVFKKKIR